MTYEEIGKLAEKVFLAEKERIAARIERAKARDSHKCESPEDGGPCYYYYDPGDFEDWCDNCKYVQPFHIKYVEVAKRVRTAKCQLTRQLNKGVKCQLPKP